MDDSWRMRMGMPGPPLLHRRSTETSSSAAAGPTRRSVDNHLDPNNFADVFGGPPRSVLARKFSGDLTRPASGSFYEEVFRPPSFACPPASKNGGRCLPAFQIPAKGEGFYSDVFGAEEDGRTSRDRSRPNSKGKSKSNSSSVLSSEELSPRRPNVSGDHDPALSSFASKLRAINVPARWNSTTMKPAGEERQQNKQEAPSFPYNRPSYAAADDSNDYCYMEKQQLHDNLKACVENYFKAQQQQQQQQFSSPETTTVEPNTSYWSTTCRGSGDDDDDDDVELEEMNNNSPASPAVSSVFCQLDSEPIPSSTPGDEQYYHNDVMRGVDDEEEEEEEDEVMSNSYVIEINNCDYNNNRDGVAVSIDEAIAWAKEKFQAHTEKEALKDVNFQSSYMEADAGDKWITTTEEEKAESERDREIEELKEEIRLWSSGKQNNIRLLLSSLHHILEPGSGWTAIPLTSIISSSQVKKAYQKARLCLHPDKLQQRGATLHHKYVAEHAFAILQDAWAAFISQ